MPAISTIPVPLYQALDPYHYLVDNLPLEGLITRIDTVNSQVDVNTSILLDAIGDQGTLSNRLNQSMNADGSLKTVAIDNALHSIAEHLDAGGFVRMTTSERSKLSLISPEATALSINFETISGTIPFVDDTITVGASDTITWDYVAGKIVADIDFPTSVRHTHNYNVIPTSGNYIDYTTPGATPYKENSLRVFVNGIRLNSTNTTYVPTGHPSSVTWAVFKFTEGAATSGVVTGGDFVMSAALSSTYRVVIDFDVLYT